MDRLKRIAGRWSFWALLAVMVGLGILHYLTPQVRPLPATSRLLERHAVERVTFLLPVAGAAFLFGQPEGLAGLVLAVLIMLPRVFLLSPYPADAFVETVAVGAVGYLLVRMIESQNREKQLRQAAASHLITINAVTSIVTGSLELEQVLNSALDKVLEVMEVKAKAASVHLLDRGSLELVLAAHRGLSSGSASEGSRFKLGVGLVGQVGQSAMPVVVDDVLDSPGLGTGLAEMEGMRSFLAVPLRAGTRTLGVMTLAGSQPRAFRSQDVQLLTAIGGHVGVAVDNARLYESARFYARQITRAQEEERKRIARDLHDETIQVLVTISRRLELATLPQQSPEATVRCLADLQELVSDTLRGLRRFVQDLRPPALDHLGLVAALVGLANGLEEESGIEVEVKVEGEARRLAPEQELGLFRIVQEALHNVRRHSEATQVTVDVAFHPGRMRTLISDDGRGFHVPDRTDGLVSAGRLGLVGMLERARLLGGTLVIQSEPGQGTTIVVDVPMQPGQNSDDSGIHNETE
jgi:signal transduction histidine kinase